MARRRFSEAELDALFGSDPVPTPASPPERVETAPTAVSEPDPLPPTIPTPSAAPPPLPPDAPAAEPPSGATTVYQIPVGAIAPNPHQPRVEFDDAKLHEMAESIRERGVLQPILVRRVGGAYQLVAGERRLRAAREAGLETIPALTVTLSERELLEVALVENLQRDDLNPIEEARAYDYLCRQFGLSHEEVARHVGKDRSTVVNMLRLLRLPQPIKNDLQTRNLTTGHARALLALDGEDQMLRLHREIRDKGLSVRQTEERVRDLLGDGAPSRRKPRNAPSLPPEIEDLQTRMTEAVGVRVRLRPQGATTGRVEIQYSSLDELDRICMRLGIEINDV